LRPGPPRSNKTTRRWFYFVGLPDKFHIQTLDCLQTPSGLHGNPTNPNIPGAYATPKANTLKVLF
jgi:hypothetical protein